MLHLPATVEMLGGGAGDAADQTRHSRFLLGTAQHTATLYVTRLGSQNPSGFRHRSLLTLG